MFIKYQKLVYKQLLCQSHYTNLHYTILSYYKFFLLRQSQVVKLDTVNLSMFSTKLRVSSNYQLLVHLLFFWFTKQQSAVFWHSKASEWRSFNALNDYWFYLLRYVFLRKLNIFSFVPTEHWYKYQMVNNFSTFWGYFLNKKELNSDLSEFFYLEGSKKAKITFSLKTNAGKVDDSFLVKKYLEVFFYRLHAYPIVYNIKELPLLCSLRKVSLAQELSFDILEKELSKFQMSELEKRTKFIYKELFKYHANKKLITEYQIFYRIKEQLTLTKKSAASSYFARKWL